MQWTLDGKEKYYSWSPSLTYWVPCLLEAANSVNPGTFLKICFSCMYYLHPPIFIFAWSRTYINGDVYYKQNCWDKTIRAKVVFLIRNRLIACYNQTACIGNLLSVLPDSFGPTEETILPNCYISHYHWKSKAFNYVFFFSFDLQNTEAVMKLNNSETSQCLKENMLFLMIIWEITLNNVLVFRLLYLSDAQDFYFNA